MNMVMFIEAIVVLVIEDYNILSKYIICDDLIDHLSDASDKICCPNRRCDGDNKDEDFSIFHRT